MLCLADEYSVLQQDLRLFVDDAVGCYCAHTVHESASSGNLFAYTLSDILVSCHKSTYALLFCLCVVIFFLQMDVS